MEHTEKNKGLLDDYLFFINKTSKYEESLYIYLVLNRLDKINQKYFKKIKVLLDLIKKNNSLIDYIHSVNYNIKEKREANERLKYYITRESNENIALIRANC